MTGRSRARRSPAWPSLPASAFLPPMSCLVCAVDCSKGTGTILRAIAWVARTRAVSAAALMMLVDEEKVNGEDRGEKYRPEFKGQLVVEANDTEHPPLPRHPITVTEILSHTSGVVPAGDPRVRGSYSLKE